MVGSSRVHFGNTHHNSLPRFHTTVTDMTKNNDMSHLIS